VINAMSERLVNEHETLTLGEDCSVLGPEQLPTKLKDRCSFSVHCTITNMSIDKTFFDFGYSVNVMPYSIFKRLGLGQLQPTHISLQLVDSSLKYPLGILENVPMKVSDFCVLSDFVILNMVEDACT